MVKKIQGSYSGYTKTQLGTGDYPSYSGYITTQLGEGGGVIHPIQVTPKHIWERGGWDN